jgi:hypothetical protein
MRLKGLLSLPAAEVDSGFGMICRKQAERLV